VIKSFAVLLVAAAGLAGAAETDKAQPPRFTSGVETVTVDIVVTDKKGNPITDLAESDFTILEDGAAQKLQSFEKIELPAQPNATPVPPPPVSSNTSKGARNGRSFVIIFDDLNLTRFSGISAKAAIQGFLQRGTREGDHVMLAATGGSAWWTARMESGRQQLLDTLKKMEGRRILPPGQDKMGDWEAMRIAVNNDATVAASVLNRWQALGVDAATLGKTSVDGSRDPMGAGMIDPYISMRAREFYDEAHRRNQATLEIMERALLGLVGSRGRKSMILVSEGFIYDPDNDVMRRVLQAARRANVAIYFLDARGLMGAPEMFTAEAAGPAQQGDVASAFIERRAEAEGSDELADESGGFTIRNTNDLTGGINRIANESRAYYLVGYNPSNQARDGHWRKIQVKINRKGLEVRARKGYFAPNNEEITPRKQEDKIHEEFRAALDSPLDEDALPLRMTALVMGETILGKATTTIVSDIDISRFDFEQTEDRFVDTAEIVLVVAQRETGEFWDRSETVELGFSPEVKSRLGRSPWYSLMRDFDLPPGSYQAKLVVRHKKSGRMGSVSHDFTVPNLSNWRVSSVVMTDVVQPKPGERGTQPKLIARRTFHAPGPIFARFEVYGAAKDPQTHLPKVEAGYTVVDKEGKVLTKADPTTIAAAMQGPVTRMVGFRTDGWTPGEYELVLNVRDQVAGQSQEIREPFTIEEAANNDVSPSVPAATPSAGG
jgi:VWFA-related protein